MSEKSILGETGYSENQFDEVSVTDAREINLGEAWSPGNRFDEVCCAKKRSILIKLVVPKIDLVKSSTSKIDFDEA